MQRFTVSLLAVAGVLMTVPAFAQAQGSNQAADYALSWGAARGGYGGVGNAYARYDQYYHRRHWR